MMYYPTIIFIIIPTIIPLLSTNIPVISHLTFLRNMVEDNSRCEALFTTSSSRVPAGKRRIVQQDLGMGMGQRPWRPSWYG